MLEMFGGTGSSSGLIHRFNNGTVGIKSGAINKFSFVVNARNCHGSGWMQGTILHTFLMLVFKKIVLLCTIDDNIFWSILKKASRGSQVNEPVDHNSFRLKADLRHFLWPHHNGPVCAVMCSKVHHCNNGAKDCNALGETHVKKQKVDLLSSELESVEG